MAEYLYAEGVNLAELKRIIESAVAEVDLGKHDATLQRDNVARPVDSKIARDFSLALSQHGNWIKITGDFGPLPRVLGNKIWKTVVVPELKHLLTHGRIESLPPEDMTKEQSIAERAASLPPKEKSIAEKWGDELRKHRTTIEQSPRIGQSRSRGIKI